MSQEVEVVLAYILCACGTNYTGQANVQGDSSDEFVMQQAKRDASKAAAIGAEQEGWHVASRADFLAGKLDLCPKCVSRLGK